MSAQRVSLGLDPALLLERVLLQRLAAIAKPRQAEWLRALLVRGLLQELRLARDLGASVQGLGDNAGSSPASRTPPSAFGTWLAEDGPRRHSTRARPVAAIAQPPVPTPEPAPGKPLAHLRKVIG